MQTAPRAPRGRRRDWRRTPFFWPRLALTSRSWETSKEAPAHCLLRDASFTPPLRRSGLAEDAAVIAGRRASISAARQWKQHQKQ